MVLSRYSAREIACLTGSPVQGKRTPCTSRLFIAGIFLVSKLMDLNFGGWREVITLRGLDLVWDFGGKILC